MPRLYPSPEQRVYDKTDRTGECWVWQATLSKGGYAMMFIDGRMRSVHRWVYEHFVGGIPDGMHLDHTCHTGDASCPGGVTCLHRRCVNPAHLEPVTPKENTRRGQSFAGVEARQTHCRRGHPLIAGNLYDVPSSAGVRRCLACRRLNEEAARRRRLTPRS